MRSTSRLFAVGGSIGLVLVMAACGSDNKDSGSATVSGGPASRPKSSTPASPAKAAATAQVAGSSLGRILVDGQMRALYAFAPDKGKAAPTCKADCADAWPPLVVSGPVSAGKDVDASLLKTVTREDGSRQATYDGWPLYHYAADSSPSDTKGQGVGGVWHVVGADGNPIEPSATTTADPAY